MDLDTSPIDDLKAGQTAKLAEFIEVVRGTKVNAENDDPADIFSAMENLLLICHETANDIPDEAIKNRIFARIGMLKGGDAGLVSRLFECVALLELANQRVANGRVERAADERHAAIEELEIVVSDTFAVVREVFRALHQPD